MTRDTRTRKQFLELKLHFFKAIFGNSCQKEFSWMLKVALDEKFVRDKIEKLWFEVNMCLLCISKKLGRLVGYNDTKNN